MGFYRLFKPRKNYKQSYQRFLHSKAWEHTKQIVLEKRRKRWDKEKLSIGYNQFKCERCGKIFSLSLAVYHHWKYKNFFTGLAWSDPRNVEIICRNCHDYIHRKNIT